MDSLNDFARAKLARLADANRRRALAPTARGEAGAVTRDGRALISFCSNDYLGLARDPRVIAAAREALDRHGAGAAASRLVDGDCPEIGRLEALLAEAKGTEAAVVFSSGYAASIGVIPALAGPDDVIVLDELSHACMHAGAKLSGAQIFRFRHNDLDHLEEQLAMAGDARRKLVLAETVYSMDGDLALVRAMFEIAARHDAWLITDDAHGFGVVAIDNPAPVQLGTLSKAAGAQGGYACISAEVAALLVNTARSFIYSTGLAPASAAAARAAVEIMHAEQARSGKARGYARRFASALGLPAPAAAIVPLIVGDETAALEASARLEAEGFLVTAIRPPSVPDGSARLRFTFSAAHEDADVARLIAATAAILNLEPA
ncbi:MAG: 8-amino-7-oxononanoate synthase [Maricaulaceae bacterium]|jgi:8-amino-7-oxononanoate synthase